MVMVHHTPCKEWTRSVPVFMYPPMVNPWGIVWPVWMWPHGLAACAMVYQPYPWTHWWIGRGFNICMDAWRSWYITYHARQRLKMCQVFSSSMLVHPCSDVWPVRMWSPCLVTCAMVYEPHPWPTDGLRGVSKSIWMIGAHGISHTNQGKSKKCASFCS